MGLCFAERRAECRNGQHSADIAFEIGKAEKEDTGTYTVRDVTDAGGNEPEEADQ